jgi:uncharacterized phage protein (TIGR01671 family)
MKREIKFRAWNEEDNRWASGLDFKREGLFINYNISDNGEFEIQADYPMRGYGRFILMQYTGLKDKNGKEIYEGDIVKVSNERYPVTTVCKWDNGCFILEDKADGHWTRQLHSQPERLKIIGNIYENPKLFES